jgi:hypothetical protein
MIDDESEVEVCIQSAHGSSILIIGDFNEILDTVPQIEERDGI